MVYCNKEDVTNIIGNKFNKFQQTLNDIAELKIEVDYIECQE